MTRAFSVTVRRPDSTPIEGAIVCVNDRCLATTAIGRVRIPDISTDWHRVQLQVEAEGFQVYSASVRLDPGDPPFGDVDWPDLYLQPGSPGGLAIDGDHFVLNDSRWLWKGSTDFRIPEQVIHGVDVRPILQDRQDAGANLVRLLSMKKNNTGWALSPRDPRHRDMMRQTFDLLGDVGLYGEWVVFADTRHWMPGPTEQAAYYAETCEIVADYPHILLELVNEAGHATQALDVRAFERPHGILASHGSGLTDQQPVKPLWDFATYHARRAGGLAKVCSNYSPYVFQDTYPTPCPYIPEETIKPAQYGHDPQVARLMGKHACCQSGGTFHHDAWNECRPFTAQEFSCATAFYDALEE